MQRSLKTKLVSQFPALEPTIDQLIPKKGQLTQIKCEDRISIYTLDNKPMFTQHFDDDLVPSLRLVHTLPPGSIPSVRVDRGAIKFILGGANIMCPGLTSKGAELPEAPGYEEGQVVAIFAEGKEHALAVGILRMSTEEIKSKNKGIGVELVQYLGDGLWNLKDQL